MAVRLWPQGPHRRLGQEVMNEIREQTLRTQRGLDSALSHDNGPWRGGFWHFTVPAGVGVGANCPGPIP